MGWTEIESPWTDEARAEAEALVESDLLICGTCGNLREVCGDPNQLWYLQKHVCHAAKAQAGEDRKYGLKHEAEPFLSWDGRRKSKKPTPLTPFHFHDGVKLWVSPEDLDDN